MLSLLSILFRRPILLVPVVLAVLAAGGFGGYQAAALAYRPQVASLSTALGEATTQAAELKGLNGQLIAQVGTQNDAILRWRKSATDAQETARRALAAAKARGEEFDRAIEALRQDLERRVYRTESCEAAAQWISGKWPR